MHPEKVINSPKTGSKKREGKERPSPLASPYREKGKGKEQCLDAKASLQYRAHVRGQARVGVCTWSKRRRYDEAGAAADEITATCFGSEDDHNKWAARMYEYPLAIGLFLEKAHECKSRFRNGEIDNPVTAFQSWINRNYPRKEVR